MSNRRTLSLAALTLLVLLGAVLAFLHLHGAKEATPPTTTAISTSPGSLYTPSVTTTNSAVTAAPSRVLGVAVPDGVSDFQTGQTGNVQLAAWLDGAVTVHLLREPLGVGQTLDSLASAYQPNIQRARVGHLDGYFTSGRASGNLALTWMTVIDGQLLQVQVSAVDGDQAQAKKLLLQLARSASR